MPNPKKKHTPMRRDMRRASNSRLEAANISKCPNCGVPRLPHHVCPSCGFYNNELILPPKQPKKKGQGEERA